MHHVFEQDPEHLQEARTVCILQRYMDFNTILLGLSAGLLASCSSVILRVLVVDLLHGTVSFVSV